MPTGIYNHKGGYKRPPFTKGWKNNISKAGTGRKLSKEHKRKIGKAIKGRKHSEKAKRKMSMAHKGKVLLEEHKRKLSDSHKGQRPRNYIDGRSIRKKSKRVKKTIIELLAKKRFRNQRYKARKRGAEGNHTFGEWELLKKQYGYICPACGVAEPEIKLTEDHIIPLSKGGSDVIENIQPLCVKCNTRKYTDIIKYEPAERR